MKQDILFFFLCYYFLMRWRKKEMGFRSIFILLMLVYHWVLLPITVGRALVKIRKMLMCSVVLTQKTVSDSWHKTFGGFLKQMLIKAIYSLVLWPTDVSMAGITNKQRLTYISVCITRCTCFGHLSHREIVILPNDVNWTFHLLLRSFIFISEESRVASGLDVSKLHRLKMS